MFIAFGMWFTATSNSFDRVSDAQDQQTDTVLDQQNTDIEILTAEYDTGTGTLTIEANNTGPEHLSLDATDLLVDGAYVSDWESGATVDGDGTTGLWLPGEQLVVTLDRAEPDRVKLISPSGVATTLEVTAV